MEASTRAPCRQEGETVLEVHGMAPIPEHNRYGRRHRIFTVWFTPNLVPAGFFIGTLGTASNIGVDFGLGVVCIVLRTVLGGLLVSRPTQSRNGQRRPSQVRSHSRRGDGLRTAP